MKDFIVDDEDDMNGGYDYHKELHETLKSKFGFDKEKYRGRFLDDDDDDLRNMESSYAQIQREEDFRYVSHCASSPQSLLFPSRRQGFQEDIDDVLREQAEKKQQRLAQPKKRPRTAA